ncbi:hypothetical protein FQZ97_1141200 [compost metagenome]
MEVEFGIVAGRLAQLAFGQALFAQFQQVGDLHLQYDEVAAAGGDRQQQDPGQPPEQATVTAASHRRLRSVRRFRCLRRLG